jgi:hypothetical protein
VCRQAGIAHDVQVAEEISAVGPDLALALFRASEFGLQRMLRQPLPRHVELIAEVDDNNRLQMTLRGNGLQPATEGPDPQAILNLQHWVGRYDGTLSWTDTGVGDALLRADAPLPSTLSAGGDSSGSRSTQAAR